MILNFTIIKDLIEMKKTERNSRDSKTTIIYKITKLNKF